MTYSDHDNSFGGIDYYTRNSDDLTIGSANLDNIIYAFWQGKLCGVNVNVSNFSNWDSLLNATRTKFGEGFQSNPYIQKYFWNGNTTVMLASYNEITKKGNLLIISEKIHREQEAWEQARAQEGAQKGF